MPGAPSLIELLELREPQTLRDLQARFPQAEDLFSTQRMLGQEEAMAMPAPTGGARPAPVQSRREAMLALVRASLDPVVAEMDRLSAQIRAAMRRAARIRFAGAIIAAAAGGLTGLLTLFVRNEAAQAVTAFAAMLGGVATMTADQFERAPSGLRIASTEEYGKLIEGRSALELIRLQLARDAVLPVPDEEMAAMLGRLDQYAVSLARLRMA